MADEEEKDQGFSVKDRRRFTESGEPRDGDPEGASVEDETSDVAPPESPSSTASEADSGARSAGGPDLGDAVAADDHAGPDEPLGEITFSGFVNGFAIQALMALGLMPDAGSGVIRKNLAEARAMIDILAMLREKTAGNLTEEEDQMMEDMLYDLRMQYVREIRGETGSQGEQ